MMGGVSMAFKTVFRRREIKFVISEEQYKFLLPYLDNYMRPDTYGKSVVQSLYYDTPSKRLIRRSLEKPLYKEKFRLRCYGTLNDNTKVFAEIKKKYKSVVYKRRTVLGRNEAESFLKTGPTTADTQIEKEILYFFKRYEPLSPTVLIGCDREAYFAKGDDGLRFTFDRNIVYRENDLRLDGGKHGKSILDEGLVLMEIKADGTLPLWVCRMLSENKMYKTSFSKYGRAYLDILKDKKEKSSNG